MNKNSLLSLYLSLLRNTLFQLFNFSLPKVIYLPEESPKGVEVLFWLFDFGGGMNVVVVVVVVGGGVSCAAVVGVVVVVVVSGVAVVAIVVL